MNNENNNGVRLNQERDNIIKATLEANNSINEEQAINVNNQIEYKKKNPIIVILVLILVMILSSLVTALVYKPIKTFVNKGDKKVTTTTTGKRNIINEYISNIKIVRKFQNEKYVLLLLPTNIDYSSGNLYYMLYDFNSNTYKKGYYTINDKEINLENIGFMKIDPKGLIYNGELIKTYDTEYKYYMYNDDKNSEVLIINGTLEHEMSMYIESSFDSVNIELNKFEETNESIKTETKEFIKNNNDIVINGHTLTYK